MEQPGRLSIPLTLGTPPTPSSDLPPCQAPTCRAPSLPQTPAMGPALTPPLCHPARHWSPSCFPPEHQHVLGIICGPRSLGLPQGARGQAPAAPSPPNPPLHVLRFPRPPRGAPPGSAPAGGVSGNPQQHGGALFAFLCHSCPGYLRTSDVHTHSSVREPISSENTWAALGSGCPVEPLVPEGPLGATASAASCPQSVSGCPIGARPPPAQCQGAAVMCLASSRRCARVRGQHLPRSPCP